MLNLTNDGLAVKDEYQMEIIDNGQSGDSRVVLCAAPNGDGDGWQYYLATNGNPVPLLDAIAHQEEVESWVSTLGLSHDNIIASIMQSQEESDGKIDRESARWAIEQMQRVRDMQAEKEYEVLEVVALHEKWARGEADGKRADLQGANLRGADLRGADLRGADLRGADLRNTNLLGANLVGANLLGANLVGADLVGADLVGADLVGADLVGANLRDANLRGANLGRANLPDTNLDGANLVGANLRDANLRGANLAGANLGRAKLRDANLMGANLRDANLRRANLRDANLDGANLVGANFRGANLRDANLRDAKTDQIRTDFFLVLSVAKSEVIGLYDFLMRGKIDGTTYDGECACLAGSIANLRKESINFRRYANRSAERWFLAIREGDTPANSPVADLTRQWIEEFAKENGISLPRYQLVSSVEFPSAFEEEEVNE